MSEKLNGLLERLQKQVERLEKIKVVGAAGGKGAGAAEEEEVPAYIEAYFDYYKEKVTPFINLTKELGEKFVVIGDMTEKSFKMLKSVLVMASKSKKPGMDKMKEVVFVPINSIVKEWDDMNFKNKGKDEQYHYTTMMEAIKCIQFVGIRDTPFKWIKETLNQALFWSNKVLQNFRKKDERHVQWVTKMKEMVNGLHDYVKEHHMTGMRWNPKGKEAKLEEGGADDDDDSDDDDDGVPPPSTAGLDLNIKPMQSTGDEKPNAGALFDEISKGGFKLKKVTRDMKTKYRKDRNFTVPDKIEKKGAATAKKAKKVVKQKPPRIAYDGGKKWNIEHQVNNKEIIITEDKVKLSHVFYIYNCQNCLVKIEGKVNSVFIDKCKKTSVIVNDLVASFEIVNSESMQVQLQGKVPVLTVDNTSGCQIFLKKESYKCEMVFSKCSEINVCPTTEDDYDEFPIPEQIEVKYNPSTKKMEWGLRVEG